MHGVVGEDKTINELHQNSERFDRKTELSFKYLQVGSAALTGGVACLQHSDLAVRCC